MKTVLSFLASPFVRAGRAVRRGTANVLKWIAAGFAGVTLRLLDLAERIEP